MEMINENGIVTFEELLENIPASQRAIEKSLSRLFLFNEIDKFITSEGRFYVKHELLIDIC